MSKNNTYNSSLSQWPVSHALKKKICTSCQLPAPQIRDVDSTCCRHLKYAVYELPAPQIRGVRAACASNTRCTSCRHLKYAVYELQAPQIRGVRAAGASNTRCTSRKYAGASNTRCTSRCRRLLTVKLWRRQLVHRVFDHHQ